MKEKFSLIVFFTLLSLISLGQNAGKAIQLKLDSISIQFHNSYNGIWYPDGRYAYNYDPQNNLQQYLHISYDIISKEWIYMDKKEFNYDANNRLTEKIFYRLYNSQLIRTFKIIYMYNSYGSLDSSLLYGWKEDTDQWLSSASSKDIFIYNSNNNNLLTLISYSRDENTREWTYLKKNEYTYNSTGKLIELINYYIPRNTSEWKEVNKREYTYYSDGKEKQFVYLLYNDSTKQWVNKRKIEYTYEDTIQAIDFTWNNTSEEWVRDSKSCLIYDQDGNLIEFISFVLESGQWIPASKYMFNYDITVEYKDLIFPPLEYVLRGFFTLDQIKYKPLAYKPLNYSTSYWSIENQDWIMNRKGTFHYSDMTVNSTSEINDHDILVYPNPVNEYLYFKTQKLTRPVRFHLYDFSGREILFEEVGYSNYINIEHLKNGPYIYIIKSKGNHQTGTLIKE